MASQAMPSGRRLIGADIHRDPRYVLAGSSQSLTRGRMPLVYVFAASKMEAQPVLVLAAPNSTSGQGSNALIIEHGADRLAVIITGMGTRNAEVAYYRVPHNSRQSWSPPSPLTRLATLRHPLPKEGEGCNPIKTRAARPAWRFAPGGKAGCRAGDRAVRGADRKLKEQHIVAYTECLSTGRGSVLHVIPDSHLSAPRPPHPARYSRHPLPQKGRGQ
jgi:hypothetical protein